MMKIESGNLNEKIKDDPQKRGWVVGRFMDNDSFFKTDNVEVKWSVREKGNKKDGEIEASSAKTLVILIKGKFSIDFPDNGEKKVLEKVGDFVSYDAHEVMHSTTAIENSTVIVIRWPSKRN